jgi:hypothetical protein
MQTVVRPRDPRDAHDHGRAARSPGGNGHLPLH